MVSTRCGEWAVIRLVDGSAHRGVLYAMDPESGHVVLLRPIESQNGACNAAPIVLFGHAIASISQGGGGASNGAGAAQLERILVRDDPESINVDGTPANLDTEDRRAAVRAMLLTQRAPFEEQTDGVFVVLGCLHIAPPYTRRACRCENEIVLDRFLELLEDALPTSRAGDTPHGGTSAGYCAF